MSSVEGKDPLRFRILIVDDHGLVRDGLRSLLEGQPDLHVVGEARTADEALAFARRLHPEIVILDVRLPDRSGIEVCGELSDAAPEARILMMSGDLDGTVVIEAAGAGALGFVSKEAPNEEILEAVRTVADGATNLGSTTARAMFRDLRGRHRQPPALARLSHREREVLAGLSEGWTNREIAAGLVLSEKTVRNHVSSVLHKLDLRHRTEAALYAAPIREHLRRSCEREPGRMSREDGASVP
jgi:DNA-binding NarL/FixJ family response regulator